MHLDQRGRVGADLVGEVGQRRRPGTAGRPAPLPRGTGDAADGRRLHVVELLAPLLLRLPGAACGRPPGRPKAPWVPLRPRPPPPGRAGPPPPPPAPGRAPGPPPAPGAPPPPRGPAPTPRPPPPPPPGRVPAPPGPPGPPRPPGPPGPPRPVPDGAGRDGMFIGLGRGPPGRGRRTRRAAGRRPTRRADQARRARGRRRDVDRRSRPGLRPRWPAGRERDPGSGPEAPSPCRSPLS